MALDVYVMPLWRFKVGDFRSPIEAATGLRPRIATAGGVEKLPAGAGWLDRWRARWAVGANRRAVAGLTDEPIAWTDEGDAIYAGQAHARSFWSLRLYAKWLDCRDRFPRVPRPGRPRPYRPPVAEVAIARPSCPHLVEHDCQSGSFLPCDFGRLAEVEPSLMYGHRPTSKSVGSTPRLLRDLDRVGAALQIPPAAADAADDPLWAVRAGYLQLRAVAELSHRHGLPIISWG